MWETLWTRGWKNKILYTHVNQENGKIVQGTGGTWSQRFRRLPPTTKVTDVSRVSLLLYLWPTTAPASVSRFLVFTNGTKTVPEVSLSVRRYGDLRGPGRFNPVKSLLFDSEPRYISRMTSYLSSLSVFRSWVSTLSLGLGGSNRFGNVWVPRPQKDNRAFHYSSVSITKGNRDGNYSVSFCRGYYCNYDGREGRWPKGPTSGEDTRKEREEGLTLSSALRNTPFPRPPLQGRKSTKSSVYRGRLEPVSGFPRLRHHTTPSEYDWVISVNDLKPLRTFG